MELQNKLSRRDLLIAGVTGVAGAVLLPHAVEFASAPTEAAKAVESQSPSVAQFSGVEEVAKLQFITDRDEQEAFMKARAAKLGRTPSILSIPTAQASECGLLAEVVTGPFIFRNVAGRVNLPQEIAANPHGIAGLGEFSREKAHQYSIGESAPWEEITDFSGVKDILPGRKYRFGHLGDAGFTPPARWVLPGNAWEVLSIAEGGEDGLFAVECGPDGTTQQQRLVENSIWSYQQWDRLKRSSNGTDFPGEGTDFGNWIAIRKITRTQDDPGREAVRLRKGHNMLFWTPVMDRRFSFEQLNELDQISESNDTQFQVFNDTSNGKLWVGEGHVGPWTGKRREGLTPTTNMYHRLWDNYNDGVQVEQPIAIPLNPITL